MAILEYIFMNLNALCTSDKYLIMLKSNQVQKTLLLTTVDLHKYKTFYSMHQISI